jgi:hypothetical protein
VPPEPLLLPCCDAIEAFAVALFNPAPLPPTAAAEEAEPPPIAMIESNRELLARVGLYAAAAPAPMLIEYWVLRLMPSCCSTIPPAPPPPPHWPA